MKYRLSRDLEINSDYRKKINEISHRVFLNIGATYILNRDGIYIYTENPHKNYFEGFVGDCIGESVFNLQKEYPVELVSFNRALGKETFRIIVEHSNAIFSEVYSPIYDGKGNVSQVIILIIDITGSVEAERENVTLRNRLLESQQVLSNKSEFIANMSHELRTPINVIYGGVQLFEFYLNSDKEIDRGKLGTHISSMKKNCMRLLKLTNNLIDTSKIDAGFYEPIFIKSNIIELLSQITQSVMEYVNQKNIKLTFVTAIENLYMLCDEDMIERIMLNLISNAIKFTKDSILISAFIDIEKDKLVISVIDNGIGIEKDKFKIIFERYRQATNLLSRQSEGSGIGLALSKALIDMHGGNISVESELGYGSEFRVELPIDHNLAENVNMEATAEVNKLNNLIQKLEIEFSDIYK